MTKYVWQLYQTLYIVFKHFTNISFLLIYRRKYKAPGAQFCPVLNSLTVLFRLPMWQGSWRSCRICQALISEHPVTNVTDVKSISSYFFQGMQLIHELHSFFDTGYVSLTETENCKAFQIKAAAPRENIFLSQLFLNLWCVQQSYQ
jgi:hypothetical protein